MTWRAISTSPYKTETNRAAIATTNAEIRRG
jgi:hypothetical protein